MTSRSVRIAAARAVEQVLASNEAFALLIRRLEAAGWRVERQVIAPSSEPSHLTPPARPR